MLTDMIKQRGVVKTQFTEQGDTFKAGYPVSTYILIIVPVVLVFLFLVLGLDIRVPVIYLPIAAIPYYLIFARKSCRIEISGHEMKVIYFFSWDRDITIDLREFRFLDYSRGIYHPFSGNSSVVQVCYDLIMLSDNSKRAQIDIRVNIRMFTFRKTIGYLQHKSNLKQTRLISFFDMIY